MTNQLFIVSLVSMVGIGQVYTAPENILPTQGKCWTNGTHYGDERPYATALPPCWVAICNDEQSTVTVATPCTAGPDVRYSSSEMAVMMRDHCYPSSRGELCGEQCCGGYRICAHDEGANRAKFNISKFLKVMNEWQERGQTGWII